MVNRIYVKKKQEQQIEAKNLKHAIKEDLNIDVLDLMIINRYDISGISEVILNKGLSTILMEPMVDEYYLEDLPFNDYLTFGIELLQGQYDQRADSLEQCFMILDPTTKGKFRYAKIYLFKLVNNDDLEIIKKYLINPVDQMFAEMNKYTSLESEKVEVLEVPIYDGFTKLNKEELNEFLNNHALAMSLEDLLVVQDYFKSINRDITESELKVLDTYWSDHCRHTTFGTIIEDIKVADGEFKDVLLDSLKDYYLSRDKVYGKDTNRPVTLMDLATIATKELRKDHKLQDLEVSAEINACSIDIKVDTNKGQKDYLLMFKNETHNHPTEIEPYGGAATCLGGAIRDPLSGRSYVYQSMRISGASDPTESVKDTIEGKLSQRKICKEAAHGFSSYGNQIGLATGYVKEIYHEGFKAKRMELGAVIASCPKEQVKREEPKADDIILLLGGRTGRDGIGGATGSSKSHDTTSTEKAGSEVQKGNPIEERKIQRLFRNSEVSNKIIRCNDFGAGGVCVAVGELADGLIIELDNVLKKYEGLNGTELAISESQERMAIVIDPKDQSFIEEACHKENLEVVKVATVTNLNKLVMNFKGQTIVDIDRLFLDQSGAKRYQDIILESPNMKTNVFNGKVEKDFVTLAKKTLDMLNVTSQKGLVEMFDATIGNNTVINPFGGKTLNTESEGMCALIPVLGMETTTTSLMTYGYNPDISLWSPYHGAMFAVIESISKIVAMGGDYTKIHFSFQEYFEKLLNDPYKWGKPMQALLGANRVLKALDLAAIGGKDSMSGTFNDLSVPPTLVSFAVTTSDVSEIITPELKNTDSILVELMLEKDDKHLINLDTLKKQYTKIKEINKDILSAYTIKTGGIIEAISKMAFGNKIGIKVNEELTLNDLVAINYGHIIIEVNKDYDLSTLSNYRIIGTTNDSESISYQNDSVSLNELYDVHTLKLEGVYPTKVTNKEYQLANYPNRSTLKVKNIVKEPLVVIPVFPGTNCEYDTIRSYEKAGCKVETVIIKNKTGKMLLDSINEFVEVLNRANILMLAGGFSAGDEPEGSGKFIATFMRNEKVKEATTRLLEEKDGLVMGICNGFQALVKLGLLPYGKIVDMKDTDPTLTFNEINRHQAKLVKTRIGSVNSPWLKYVNVNDEFITPISHGEGRFIANKEVIQELFDNGQVFSQYTNDNPNGSDESIEGIVSKCGRIIGKMAHSERIGDNRLLNIYGDTDQKLFQSAVSYFKGE